MKPEHLKEATKLADDYRVLHEQIAALDTDDKLQLNFFNRSISMEPTDPKFSEIRSAARTFLVLRTMQLVRRANQLGLHLESPVQRPEPVKIKETVSNPVNLIHSLDKGPSIADEAEALFGKPVLR